MKNYMISNSCSEYENEVDCMKVEGFERKLKLKL